MGFLVGNDFIPNLPHFHINKGALPLLYSAYMDVLPTLDGYINENGLLNLPRFEKFMERLAQIDYDHFNDIYADVKWLESRHGRKKLVEVLLLLFELSFLSFSYLHSCFFLLCLFYEMPVVRVRSKATDYRHHKFFACQSS